MANYNLSPVVGSGADGPRARQQVGENSTRLRVVRPRAAGPVASFGISVGGQRRAPIGAPTLAPLLFRAPVERCVAETTHPEADELVGAVTEVRCTKLVQHDPAGSVEIVHNRIGLFDDGDVGGGATKAPEDNSTALESTAVVNLEG